MHSIEDSVQDMQQEMQQNAQVDLFPCVACDALFVCNVDLDVTIILLYRYDVMTTFIYLTSIHKMEFVCYSVITIFITKINN